MKKGNTFLALLLSIVFMSTAVTSAATVTEQGASVDDKHKPIVQINEKVFPNQLVRRAVLEDYDMNGDGYLSQYEIDQVTSFAVDVAYMQERDSEKNGNGVYNDEKYLVIDFKGIEIFKNLKKLYFSCGLVNGKSGYVKDFNNLTKLNIQSIGIYYSTKKYDLNQFKNLKTVDLGYCENLDLKFNKNSKVQKIELEGCTGKVDVSKMTKLKTFDSKETVFKELKFGKNVKLQKINIEGSIKCINKKIKKIDLSKMKNIKVIELENCTKLKEIKTSKKNNKKLKKISLFNCGKFKRSDLNKAQLPKKTKVRIR